MANQIQVKRRIGTAKNISKITKAMEMVAASKMKKAQDQALAARPYSQALYDSIATISQASKLDEHPLLSNHEKGIPMILIIGTDKGLCGALNGNLMKKLSLWKKEHKNGEVIAVGKKAVLSARSLGMTVHAQFTQIVEDVETKDLLPIMTLVLNGFSDQKFKSVDILYTDFINTLSQKPKQAALLPLSRTFKPDVVVSKVNEEMTTKAYVFEPSPKQILDNLLPFYLENTIFHSFIEAKASEHSARMVSMKNASENAGELVDELKLIYNKTRQQGITTELLDIISATMSLN
ncbi:MAG: ATP synthase F1 subunit gamma [Candidatus Pacebacteria bacterium]|mgnify:FL=1|jgi:F-type H+-transporting ATPase subunit gamma|nr:ATP synthase F1 subunit gamma [Candidatus Paceibacterota bacterium]MBT4651866.1 ATP synthase F1 subunit gamma [Candidatus Paceibacterota bacterium]MBT6755686.1 ATP synthase F1 subunit gamma [Candidatus Paceibacterota bacterium]MBT6921192.1 ATP synthase F1 subunit gamma [Candidatus Paceibacterota bacterium]